ncbi:hypothetical protein ACQ4LE_005223 [Meloidogyne hapla]
MLRYLRSRIGSSYEVKNYEQKDFVNYTKIATHGFPQKVSCFALSENFGLLAIGTKDGKLQIYTPNGSQINIQIEFPIISIYFLDSSKTILIQYNNLTKTKYSLFHFFFCKIVNNELNLTQNSDLIPEDFLLSKECFNCCKVLDGNGNSALLLGTTFGNIYTIWASSKISNESPKEISKFVVFQNTALAGIEELKLQQNRTISEININPFNANKIVLLFNNSLIIVFDNAKDVILNKIVVSSRITSICSDSTFQTFFCSLSDGFYFNFNLTDDLNKEIILKPKSYFEGNNFTKMSKILISRNEKFEQFVIFSGGIPDDLECQNPICIFCGDNSLILNFDSEIINFEIFEEKGIPRALFVLCQDELVAIDLKDSLWRMFSLPYLYPIHSSPVTCVLAISDISEQILSLFEQISIERRNSSKIFSSNKWPLERLEHEVTTSRIVDEDNFLILTGHDNGNVCIWQATNLNFNLLLVCNTAKEFEGYQSEEEENSQNKEENNNKIKQIPPIRKAGIFDPFSDDHRLCIQKIYFDSKSGTFAVGGQAGQLMVFETLWKRTSPANQLLLIDMTSSGDDLENLRASESAIQPRNSQINYEHGFCLYNNIIAQFKPPVPVTAISWNFNMGVLAAGNEFGYAVCSIRERKLLLIKTLMSSLDVLQISNKDSALSRFKSVKKSIRQSFRRKKQPAEQLENGGSIPTQQNRHRQEREITQRKRNPNALDGETPNSLIKILNFETCILSPFNAHPEVYLFVGTQGGAVLIHLIRSDVCGNSERCQLIKEIRLRHHAPIAAIELFQQQPNSRLLVFSEEQIRSFIMPSLKSFTFKYRLTAIEGSRIKKAKTVLIGNETKTLQEKFLAVITNRGEIFFISPTNPKCLHKISFVQPNNTIGIFSSVIAQKGQIFYLNSGGSEFVRLGSHLMSYNNLKCNGVEMSGQKDK